MKAEACGFCDEGVYYRLGPPGGEPCPYCDGTGYVQEVGK